MNENEIRNFVWSTCIFK